MSKNVAKLVIALSFLSLLFVASGQDRLIATRDRSVSAPQEQAAPAVLVPQINKYGSLVGLKDTTGKDLLKEIGHRWREGYAIAYQVKNSKGAYAHRFVYVMGDKVSARKLKVERRKSTTSRKVVTTGDRALEIGRLITWDEKSRALKSDITITNTSNREVMLSAIEIEIDKSVAARLIVSGTIDPNCPLPFRASITDPGRITLPANGADPGRITPLASDATRGSAECDECPPCPCVRPPYCESNSGQAIAFDRDPMNPGPVNLEDIIGLKLPRFNAPMLCLSWAGSNLSRSVLKPGERILVHYRLIIPQPTK